MKTLWSRCCRQGALLASLLSVPVSASIAEEARLSEAEQRAGWKLLFDGKSTEGWRNYKSDKMNPGWVVEDGLLIRKEKGAGDIVTKDQFGSFEIQLEYRISKGGNSGLMFHVAEEAGPPWHTGPEVQIQDNVDGHDPQKAGWLYQLYSPQKPEWAIRFEKQVGFKGVDVDDATRPAGEWNHLYLRVTPNDGEVCVNGVSYYKFNMNSKDWDERVAKSKFAKLAMFGKTKQGHVCLQDHGNEVAFRNIRARKLTDDGKAPEPVDGTLALKTELAFPNVEWEGWDTHDADGRPNPPLRPIQVTHAGDGSNRVFIIDQSGMIHVLPNDPAAKKAKLYADFRKRTHQFKIDDEEGLLGFAFHPDYKKNGEFFLYYNTESAAQTIYLSRFKVSKTDADRADPDSEEVLTVIKQPFSNHNGGPMAFGPDGMLYIGMGDGGGRNDPTHLGQARSSFMGAVLRIDVNHKDEGKKYAVPKDNPFLGIDKVPGEIYAYGFRNPWRLAFDRKTGHLWLADVGQDLWEEIDIVKKGGNYGWSVREGSLAFGNEKHAPDAKFVAPVWEYDHRLGKSITGGHVYRGSKLPELAGHYLYGDFVSGKLWALHYDEANGKVVRNMSLPWNGLPVLAFGEDEQGESFVTTPTASGKGVYRIVNGK